MVRTMNSSANNERIKRIMRFSFHICFFAATVLLTETLGDAGVSAQIYPWIRRAGGESDDVLSDMVLNPSGNCIITGWFQDSATFGVREIESEGEDDIFVASYNYVSATIEWVKRDGGQSSDQAFGIATDEEGSIIVVGRFSDETLFGVGDGQDIRLTSAGDKDVFIVKYDPSGRLCWAKRAGGSNFDLGFDVAVDGFGNVFVVGWFRGSTVFGPNEPNETTLSSENDYDVFIAKYRGNDGTLVWVKRAGGSHADHGFGVATDPAGNVFVTGAFQDVGRFNVITHTSAGDYDMFIAKYDSSGEVLWVKRAGGNDSDAGLAVALDSENHVLVAGKFQGTAYFDDITLSYLDRN